MNIGYRLLAPAAMVALIGCAGAGVMKGSAPLSFDPKDFPGNGQCRIWDPAKPREAQAESESCGEITKQLAPEAWLLRRGGSESVIVYIYSAGKVAATHEYDAHTAEYLGKR